jgi:hypothetical protein
VTSSDSMTAWIPLDAWEYQGSINPTWFHQLWWIKVKYLLIHHTLYFIILSKPMKKMQRQIIYSAKQIKTAIYWFITFQERQLTPCRGRDARHTQPFLGSCSPADFSNQVDEHPSHGHVRKKCGNRGYLSKINID